MGDFGLTEIVCARCGCPAMKPTGGVNRSVRNGAPLYCGRACAGLARRTGKSIELRKAEKAEYDREYRLRDPLKRKADKAAYHRRTYDPVAAAAHRKTRMPYHVEYCRRPEYRKWKAQYDQKYRARKFFGDFGEAAIVLNKLEAEISSRATWTEIRAANGTLNKHQQRRRDYERQTQRR